MLVVARLDRLSRSVRDFGELAERARRRSWAVVALDLGVDTTTPAGELVAKPDAGDPARRERIARALSDEAPLVLRSACPHVGRPPVLPSEIVQRVVQERREGRTVRGIAAGLTADGVPTARGGAVWSPSSMQSVLASQQAADLG